MRHTIYKTTVCLALMLLIASMASASDPSGNWSSSTGSRVYVQAELTGILVSVTTNKGTWRYQGRWTNMPWSFQYFVPNYGTYYAAYDGSNMNRILVRCPDGSTTVWTRGGNTYQQPRQPTYSIDGVWVSTSGNTFQVDSRGNQLLIALINQQGQRWTGHGRWVQKGVKFEYSISGLNAGLSVGYFLSANKVKVVGRTTSYWERVQ